MKIQNLGLINQSDEIYKKFVIRMGSENEPFSIRRKMKRHALLFWG